MNDFVEQCRREWRLLGVRGAVADEMATELAADLDEGASAEEVLGSDAADARAFAATWARERGVIPRRTRNPRVIMPIVAAALTLVAIAGAVLMGTASSGTPSEAVAVGPPLELIKEPQLPPTSGRVRVYDGPPLHVRYVRRPAFTERAIDLKLSPAVSERRPACVDGGDFTATPCVWPAFATHIATKSPGADWSRVGFAMTLFGSLGLILLASAWLWSRADRSHHAIP